MRARWRRSFGGVLVALVCAVAIVYATDVTDDFNSGIGGNWTNPGQAAWSAFTAASSRAECTSASCLMYWTGNTFQTDQYSQGVATSGTAGQPAAIVRGSTSTDRFYMCYWAFGGSGGFFAFRRDPGSFTQLADYGSAGSGPHTIKATVTGTSSTSLTCSLDGVDKSPSVEGSTYTSGEVGLFILSGGAATATYFDDWLGGPITGGGGCTAPPNQLVMVGVGNCKGDEAR